MKRIISLLMICCLLSPSALAENGESGSFLDSVGSWFTQRAEDASNWVSETWNNASKWMEGAWGDASKWVEQSWNDSSSWVADIWGDVSTWTSDNLDSADAWWTETFNNITGSNKKAWDWLITETDSSASEFHDDFVNIKQAVSSIGDSALQTTKDSYITLLKKLELDDTQSEKIWNTLMSYADQKGFDQLTTAKIALPYLFKLVVDGSLSGKTIPAIAIAQYLTATLDKLNINTNDTAIALVNQLNELFASF